MRRSPRSAAGRARSTPARTDEVKDAAYDFLSYMSQPEQANEDVTIGITGFNPYRISQFENLDLWLKAGMSEAAAKNYLGAIEDSLNSPNMVLDLRVPQNQRYEQIVLDTAIARAARRRDRHAIRRWPRSRPAGTKSPKSSATTSSSRPTRRRSASGPSEARSSGGDARRPDGLCRAGARVRAARSGPWDWLTRGLDRHAPAVFIMPAVLVVLAMSIFPLLVSLYLSLARFKFVKGGFQLKFVGLLNYKKLLLG